MDDSIKVSDTAEIPETASGRVADLLELPLDRKQGFVPPVGFEFRMGPFTYKVTVTNPGQLRFTAQLADVKVESDKPKIISPHTLRPIAGGAA